MACIIVGIVLLKFAQANQGLILICGGFFLAVSGYNLIAWSWITNDIQIEP
jgi:hypothetical protein